MLNTPSLSDATFRVLRDFIYEKSGIFISDSKKYLLENRLSRILQEKKFKNFEDYLSFIRYGSNGNDLTRLFDAVTTNETYFFREPQQLDVFIRDIVPGIMKRKKPGEKLKIWSAACSTGEEPYTLSMMAQESGIDRSRLEIHATDLSERALNSARNGVYNSYSVRNVPDRYLRAFFSGDGQAYTLCRSIRDSVKFMNANLIDYTKMKAFRGFDAVFCRNVLIYFDLKAKQAAVSHLYDSLKSDGYLVIGSSESLHNVTRAFRPNVINKIITYQKI